MPRLPLLWILGLPVDASLTVFLILLFLVARVARWIFIGADDVFVIAGIDIQNFLNTVSNGLQYAINVLIKGYDGWINDVADYDFLHLGHPFHFMVHLTLNPVSWPVNPIDYTSNPKFIQAQVLLQCALSASLRNEFLDPFRMEFNNRICAMYLNSNTGTRYWLSTKLLWLTWDECTNFPVVEDFLWGCMVLGADWFVVEIFIAFALFLTWWDLRRLEGFARNILKDVFGFVEKELFGITPTTPAAHSFKKGPFAGSRKKRSDHIHLLNFILKTLLAFYTSLVFQRVIYGGTDVFISTVDILQPMINGPMQKINGPLIDTVINGDIVDPLNDAIGFLDGFCVLGHCPFSGLHTIDQCPNLPLHEPPSSSANAEEEKEEDADDDRWAADLPGRFFRGVEWYLRVLVAQYDVALLIINMGFICFLLFYVADGCQAVVYEGDKLFLDSVQVGQDGINDIIDGLNDAISPQGGPNIQPGVLYDGCVGTLTGLDDVASVFGLDGPDVSDCDSLPTISQVNWIQSQAYQNALAIRSCQTTDSFAGEVAGPLRAETNDAVCDLYLHGTNPFQRNMGRIFVYPLSWDGCVTPTVQGSWWWCTIINIKYMFIEILLVVPGLVLFLACVWTFGVIAHFFGGILTGLRVVVGREAVTRADRERNEERADIMEHRLERQVQRLAVVQTEEAVPAGGKPTSASERHEEIKETALKMERGKERPPIVSVHQGPSI